MKRTLLYILTLLFLLSSCERKIAYNGEVTQSKLVLQAEIGEGDTVVRAYVSRSRFFTELQNYYWGDSRLQSAIVEIQRDDQAWQQMDTCLVERKGYLPDRFFVLHLDSALRAGERVRIRVSHKDYETITAEQTVVHKPQCRVGDYAGKPDTLSRTKNYIALPLVLQEYPFTDATLGVSVSCMLHIYYQQGSNTDERYETVRFFRSYDQLFASSNNVASGQTSFASRYELFVQPGYADGYHVDLEIPFSASLYSYMGTMEVVDVTIDTMTVCFNAHSSDSYLYRRSMYLARGESNTDGALDIGAEIGEMFGQEEDVQVYSNIAKGYGIFAACSRYKVVKHDIKTVTQ